MVINDWSFLEIYQIGRLVIYINLDNGTIIKASELIYC
jgi:hypothetical protein